MPNCTLCSKPFKTRGTLAKHQRLYHDGRTMDDSQPPIRFTLTFFVNEFRQTLTCPICPFSRDRCKSVKPIATHFQKVHPLYQLVVSYHCQWCNGYIDPAEIRLHAHAHFENLALNKPFSPPIPSINPADSSLSFSDAEGKPVVGNIGDDFIIQDSQPVPLCTRTIMM